VVWGVSAVAVAALVVAIVASGRSPGHGRSPREKLAVSGAPLVAATNGKIAFIRRSESSEDRTSKIFLMNADGSDQTLLAETTGGSGLAWSPDGRKLAFADGGGIHTVNADGTGDTRMPTGDGPAGWPTWSPEGTRLAFRSLNGDGGGIYVANLDGTDRKQLTRETGDLDLAWSPDGTRIAFAREGSIAVMNADGSAPTRLTSTHSDGEPTWSPDSRQLAFRHNSSISVIDADGGAVRTLTSPGGTGTVRSGGGGAKRSAAGGGDPSHATWSPDGSRIAYALYHSGASCSVWAMNADGTGANKLTDGSRCDFDPAWQPIPRSN